MPLIVSVPRWLSSDTMYRLIQAAADGRTPRDEEISLDFTDVKFVDAFGLATLSNLVDWLRRRGVIVSYRNCDRANEGVAYLDDVGFFAAHWQAALSPNARLRQTTYPFTRLQCVDAHQWIDGNVFPWLADKLNVRPSALYELKTSVREIFNNISDHSTEQIGCMHVQVHPNIGRVKIAISDFGVGIPAEVRKVAGPGHDVQMLRLAATEGFSSKPGKNKGAGLSYLIDNVVKRNQGWLGIYSGEGSITFNHVQHHSNLNVTPCLYPGTLISMILRRDNLVANDDAEEDTPW
jgi:hypothetical protein